MILAYSAIGRVIVTNDSTVVGEEIEGESKNSQSIDPPEMVELLTELAPTEGFHTTILDGVQLRRSDRNEPRTPVMYGPSVYFVASGRKKGYVGDRCIEYDANNYVVLPVPLPLECEAETGNGERCSEFRSDWDIGVISEVAANMDKIIVELSGDGSRVCTRPPGSYLE